MSVKWIRTSAIFILLVTIFGCSGMYTNDAGQDSRKSIVITIDLQRREEFFNQLRKFAEANSFSILIDTLSSSDEEFQVYMRREDVFISGASLDPNEYHIGFYDIDVRHPAPDSVFDNMVSELEQYVSEVPGTTFFIRK